MDDMTEFLIRISAFVLLIIVLPISLVMWRGRVKKRRTKSEHQERLRLLAQQLSGQISMEPNSCWPWSAQLRPAFNEVVTGGLLTQVRARTTPQYDYALSFARRGWHVRIAEASMIQSGPHHNGIIKHEHRIEIGTRPSPAFAISPALSDTAFRTLGMTVTTPDLNQQIFDEEASRPRAGSTTGQSWLPVRIPASFEGQLRAYSESEQFAALAFNGHSVGWLVHGKEYLRHLIIVEHGILYAIGKDKIDTESVLATVDLLIGFLERIPPEAWHGGNTNAARQQVASTARPTGAPLTSIPAVQPVPVGATKKWNALNWAPWVGLAVVVIASFLWTVI